MRKSASAFTIVLLVVGCGANNSGPQPLGQSGKADGEYCACRAFLPADFVVAADDAIPDSEKSCYDRDPLPEVVVPPLVRQWAPVVQPELLQALLLANEGVVSMTLTFADEQAIDDAEAVLTDMGPEVVPGAMDRDSLRYDIAVQRSLVWRVIAAAAPTSVEPDAANPVSIERGPRSRVWAKISPALTLALLTEGADELLDVIMRAPQQATYMFTRTQLATAGIGLGASAFHDTLDRIAFAAMGTPKALLPALCRTLLKSAAPGITEQVIIAVDQPEQMTAVLQQIDTDTELTTLSSVDKYALVEGSIDALSTIRAIPEVTDAELAFESTLSIHFD